MGNCQNVQEISIGIREHLQEQFYRVKKDEKRKYLTVSQVLQIKHPEDYPFDFRHLGNLFVCDQTLDGVFTLSDFQRFIIWVQNNMQYVQMYEFKSELQSRTVALMIEKLKKQDGQSIIVNWFIRLLLEDNPKIKNENQHYIKIQGIKVMYEIFNVKVMNDMNIQSFFYLIKRSSEDLGFPIEEVTEHEQQQEYIAITYVNNSLEAFQKELLKY